MRSNAARRGERRESLTSDAAHVSVSFEVALGRARVLAYGSSRRIVGIVGMPGSGKSTLASRLVEILAPKAVIVPMDGFHLAGAELARLGRNEREGAVDTFDAAGYIALLRRLREPEQGVIVYAPSFSREIEERDRRAAVPPRGCGPGVSFRQSSPHRSCRRPRYQTGGLRTSRSLSRLSALRSVRRFPVLW